MTFFRISACGLLVTVCHGEVLDTFFFVGLRSSLITSLLVRGQETGNDYFYLNNVFDVSSPLLRENST